MYLTSNIFVLEKSTAKAGVYPEDKNFGPTIDPTKPPLSFDYLFNAPNRPLTRSLTRLLHEQHSINFVQTDLHDKLSSICEKLYKLNVPFSSLAPDEQLLWSAYDLDDIMFFLTGDRNFCPDYSVYTRIWQQPQLMLPQPQPAVMPQPWPPHRAVVDPRNIVEHP